MRRICVLFLVSLVQCVYSDSAINSAITYELNGGRFGDNLRSYAIAKWLSLQYNLPLLYLPFPYSDELMIAELEQSYSIEADGGFKDIVYLPSSRELKLKNNNNALYVSHWRARVKLDWNSQVFVEQLRRTIAPRYHIDKVAIPAGYLSVAVHVRNGGGFVVDTEQEKERCPLRFVPEEFFIDQVARIADMFPDQSIYVHIFTDHPQPAELAQKFHKTLHNDRVIFGYREVGNSHKSYVLEDFFSMMDFDCLVRPGSHFSRFVERLGTNKIVIYPYSVKKNSQGTSVIDVVAVKTRSVKGWKTTKYVIA